MDIAIGDTVLIFAEPPFMVSGTLDATVPFGFIDTDGFREFLGQTKEHRLKDRLDDG